MRYALTTGLFILLLLSCSPKDREVPKGYALVPANTAVVFQYNDHGNFLKDLENHSVAQQLNGLHAAKLIKEKLAPLKYVKNKSKALLMLTAETSQRFDFAYISLDTIPELPLDSLKNSIVETVTQNNYEMQRIEVDSTVFFTRTIAGHHVVSSSSQLMERMEMAVDQEEHHGILRFAKVLDPSKAGHLVIHSKFSDSLAKLLFRGSFRHPISHFSDWWALDLSLENDALLLNGISIPADSMGTYLNLFQGTKTAHPLAQMMPRETEHYKALGIGNFHQFIKKQELLPLAHPILADSIFNTTETVGLSQTPNGTILYLETYGATGILDFLKTRQTETKDFQGLELLELADTNGLNDVFTLFTTSFTARFASVLENTVVLTENEESMNLALVAHKNGDTFETSPLWHNSTDLTTGEASLTLMANNKGFMQFLEQETNGPTVQEFGSLTLDDHLFVAQLISEDRFFHAQYGIKKLKSVSAVNEIEKLFSVALDTELATPPQFVLNHRTGNMEVVVQDRDHILYLISSSGNILWQKQLNGPIQGKVHQVDLYKNNKLQLAFTTDSQFMVLDRNGKPVAPFTFNYEGGNLNGLSVFDYDGNKDYRFVVTQNEKVFMYNNKAQKVNGFTYTKANAPIMAPPQHFRIGTRDYLVFQLKNGQLKILNRTGQERVNVREDIPFSQNRIHLYKDRFTTTTTDGFLVEINTKGTLQKTQLGLHKEHGMDATSRTLAIMDDNVLRIRDKKVSLELGVYSAPQIFYLNDKIYVSVTDIQNQKTFLFDSQGKAIANFPLYGMSPVDMANMDNDKKPELVVQDQENVLAVYKLN